MNAPRYNAFNPIHKALRTLMFDTVLRLQRSDLGNVEESLPAIRQVGLLLQLMDGHAHHEDHFILHPIEEKAPAFILEFEGEHVTDLALGKQLREMIEAWHGAEDKREAGSRLYYALNAFVAFNLNHMNKEEHELNQLLWRHYSDADILGMVRRIQQSVPPEEMRIVAEWMIQGLNNPEILQWLGAVKQEAPEFVYQSLIATCERILPASRLESIRSGLKESQVA
ncbi:MAG TPA: hemerythrin domain-containing protein [Puia sp.]|uniref:hemerythrin domain-containing protein n=1 Tax=Puia sp. TaxID=2045100 RepID=UPI002CF57947|nr:hemerythrin domain-containing protein [Puia sp.]HVU93588.1 hemerythrin domain-containing protein [Puia sp.]